MAMICINRDRECDGCGQCDHFLEGAEMPEGTWGYCKKCGEALKEAEEYDNLCADCQKETLQMFRHYFNQFTLEQKEWLDEYFDGKSLF